MLARAGAVWAGLLILAVTNGFRDALEIGVLWLALTLAFEFLAGHYLFHSPWQTLVADYT